MGIFKKLFGHDSETADQREERLYREDSHVSPSGSSACFKVDDVFSIKGRGTVVVGNVTDGTFSIDDKICINKHSNGEIYKTVIIGIELFRKQVDSVGKGENAGLLLRGIERNQISKGDLIIK